MAAVTPEMLAKVWDGFDYHMDIYPEGDILTTCNKINK